LVTTSRLGERMVWETKNNGLFRCVRLTRRLAFKTPRVLNRRQLKNDWRISGRPKSIRWLLRTWCKLFRENRMSNQAEVRRWQEWQQNGAQKVSGVGLCPILFHLPLGLLVVMRKAGRVSEGRISKLDDPMSNGIVSFEEMRAAAFLMGLDADTGKPDTYGLVDGGLVVVDYGFFVPTAKNH